MTVMTLKVYHKMNGEDANFIYASYIIFTPFNGSSNLLNDVALHLRGVIDLQLLPMAINSTIF